MEKRVLSFVLALVILVCGSVPVAASAQTYEEQLLSMGFPESYIPALVALHNKYPNWNFNIFNTKLDWNTAVTMERQKHSQQLIQTIKGRSNNYYCDCASCLVNGKYVVREGSNWVAASNYAVAYYLDPRNWLDESHIFQFESIFYDATQTQEGVESIFANSWLANKDITYLTTGLNSKTYQSNGANVKYSQAIMDAASYSGMSAYYLASRMMQEVGGNSSASGVVGNVVPFTGIYNFFSIGANSGANDGLAWASGYMSANEDTFIYPSYTSSTGQVSGDAVKINKSQNMTWMQTCGNYYKVRLYNELGKNSYSTNGMIGYVSVSSCRTVYFNYGRPWTNPYKAIYNGAKYIANNFSTYQFTPYLQKFNVNGDYYAPYTHEYMANVSAPASESEISYKAYVNNGLIGGVKNFYIPVFYNMPATPSPEPSKANITQPPAVVGDLTVSNIGIDNISLSWSAVDTADGYYVYQYDPNTNASTWLATVTSGTAFTHTGLKSNKRYDYYVVAYNIIGAGEISPIVNATTIKIDKPVAVTGLKLSSNNTSSIKIKWNKSERAWGYYVYRYSSKTKKYTKIATINDANVTSYKQTNLNAGCGYDYAVVAFNPAGNTKKSAILHTCTKPSKVSSLKLSTKASNHIVKASWKANKNCTGYQVQFSRKKDFSKVIATKTVGSKSTISYTGKNFTKGVRYYVRVRAYKTSNSKKYYGSWSSAKSIVSK